MNVQSLQKQEDNIFKKLLNYNDIYVVNLDELNQQLINERASRQIKLKRVRRISKFSKFKKNNRHYLRKFNKS